MEKYIAFLRGINISGKNKISMAELKIVFEKNNFHNVKTYINSGNVIFKTDINDKTKLINKIEIAIAENFNLNIPVTVISQEELSDALKNSPDWWTVDKEYVTHAIFLIPPIKVEEVFKAVGEIKPEYEKLSSYNDIIFWSAPREYFSKTKWSKIASSSVNNNVTIRTSNTVNKLYQLIKDTE